MAVSAFDNSPLQRLLGKELQKQIAIRIILRDEKNLDLLQGLLVHIAYYHYFFTRENQQMYLMVQLALTLVHELGLHHSARPGKHLEGASTHWGKMGSAETYGERSGEELRSFLGIFILADEYIFTASFPLFTDGLIFGPASRRYFVNKILCATKISLCNVANNLWIQKRALVIDGYTTMCNSQFFRGE